MDCRVVQRWASEGGRLLVISGRANVETGRWGAPPSRTVIAVSTVTRFLQGQFSSLSLTTFSLNFFILDPLFLVTLACPDGQRRASGEGRLLADSGGKLGLVHE